MKLDKYVLDYEFKKNDLSDSSNQLIELDSMI